MVKKIRKKKKNTNKKVVNLTLTTKKSEFANNIIILQQKGKLYDKLPVEEIKKEMDKYGISIEPEDVIERYNKCYDIDDVIHQYHAIYDEQLDSISTLGLLFDDDCIIHYVTKLLSAYSKENNVPVPDLIIESFMDLPRLSTKKVPQHFLEILQSINLLKSYHKETKLDKLFAKTVFNMEWAISDALGTTIHNCFIDLEMTKKITGEVFLLVSNYELEHPEYVVESSLELLAMHGYEEVKDKFEQSLIEYPMNQLRMYNAIISELLFYAKKTKNYEDVIEIYNRATHATLHSPDDKESLELIIENYGKEINELTNN